MSSDPYKAREHEVPESRPFSSKESDLKMFSQLADFGFKRTPKQAVGFYISYLFLGLIMGVVAGGMAGVLNPDHAQQAALIAGGIVAVIYVVTIAVLVAIKRSLLNSFLAIFLVVLAALLSLLLGALGGLVPVSFLTAIEGNPNNKAKQVGTH